MIPRFVLAVVLAMLLPLSACDLVGSDAVQLRVENASAVDFSSVAVGPEGDERFGAVSSGSASAYRKVDRATERTYIEATAAGELYRVLPFHNGYEDEILEPGRYTYVLDIVDSRLTMRLEED